VTAAGRPVLWDVDTQVDFAQPSGKLYVSGAEHTLANMARLVSWAREAGIVHVASADDHELTDAEISHEPDFDATWPPHCLRGTPGARRVPETDQADPVPLGLEPLPADDVAELIRGHREILLHKKSVDVFDNPNTDAVVSALHPSEAIVFGLATDVCNHFAIVGLRERGVPVTFVEDASCAISEQRAAARAAEWRELDVRVARTDDIVAGL
jgi:nicotinamidase/pyrazinamidase